MIFLTSLVGVQLLTLISEQPVAGLECGVEASTNLVHHNPWLVYVEFYRHNHLTDIRCAGTLIDSRHVLTAAHCVQKRKFSRLTARLGEYDVSTEKDCRHGICADPTVSIHVDKIIVHPEYTGTSHDIAILRLKEDAPYTDFIRPVCLPSGKLSGDVTFAAAGWGEKPSTGMFSDTKKILPLPLWEKEKCQKVYSSIRIPEFTICAGGEEGIDTCRGDSGGPLTWHKKTVEIWGITSGGNVHCGTAGVPAVYTNVADHMDWIKAVINV